MSDGSGTSTNYTHTGLTAGLPYTYRISATNSVGTGPASTVATATPFETHVFLLAGQSNMAGGDAFDGGDDWPAGVLQLRYTGANSASGALTTANVDNDIVPADLNLQHVSGGGQNNTSLGLQFALDYVAQNPDVQLVLIARAVAAAS